MTTKKKSENEVIQGLRKENDRLCAKCKRLMSENADLRRLSTVNAKLFFMMNECYKTNCPDCEARVLCAESVHLEGIYGIDKDLA